MVLSLVFLGVSCGDKGVPPDDDKVFSTLEIIAGNNQTGPVGKFLTDSLTVRVFSSLGIPVAGDVVHFSQISAVNGGQIIFSERVTDDEGYAFTRYRLDTLIGVDTIKVVSDAAGDSAAVYFKLTVTPGKARDIRKIWPLTTVSTIAGEPLADSVVVMVTDRYGNPTGNENVYFKTINRSVVATDLMAQLPYSIDSAYTVCDANGLASAEWTLSVNPNPFGLYPNGTHMLEAFINVGDTVHDTVKFSASATNPGVLKYYNNIRPILAENCFQCHSTNDGYRVDVYFELLRNGDLVPGDTNSPFLAQCDPFNHLGNCNMVEQDKIIRWVVKNSASPGSSGLNNYTDNMKSIIDMSCVTCHAAPTPPNGYIMSSHLDIRGGGLDSVPNAIPGADTSLVVEKMQQRHQWNSLNPDSVAAAVLADSIITWIVDDLMRQY